MISQRKREDGKTCSACCGFAADDAGRRVKHADYEEARKREALGLLAGGFAHSINNRLTAVLGYSELLVEDASDLSNVREYARTIYAESQRAADVCRQMLDYAGHNEMRREPIDVHALVEGVCQRVWVPEGVTLRTDPSLVSGLRVWGDPKQMGEALRNVVENGIEAVASREDGVVTLSIEAVRQWDTTPEGARFLPFFSMGEYVQLVVSDNGDGVIADPIEQIFDPSYSTRGEGRGLGLAVVEGILRACRGGIRVASQPGHGARVALYLPFADRDDADTKDVSSRRACDTVLVVEDNKEICLIIEDTLEMGGYEALIAGNEKDAVALFAEHAHRIACVVMDLQLPDGNGSDLMTSLRQIDPDVRVLVQSGYSREVAASRMTLSERTTFLEKPYTCDRLLAAVESLLHR